MAKSLDHVCILVNDIDQAIEHYRNILSETAPEVLEQRIEKYEHQAGKDRYVFTYLVAPGDGCNIQLLQPLNSESALYKRLQKYGEHIHHLAFTSTNLENTFQRLKEKGVSFHSDQFVSRADDPTSRWAWIVPGYAHGALIELMDEKLSGGYSRHH